MSARQFGFLAYCFLGLATLGVLTGKSTAAGIIFGWAVTCLAASKMLKALGK